MHISLDSLESAGACKDVIDRLYPVIGEERWRITKRNLTRLVNGLIKSYRENPPFMYGSTMDDHEIQHLIGSHTYWFLYQYLFNSALAYRFNLNLEWRHSLIRHQIDWVWEHIKNIPKIKIDLYL